MHRFLDLINLMKETDLSEKEYQHLNMAGMFVLSRVCASQSIMMGIAGAGFKYLKAAGGVLARQFPALPDADPSLEPMHYITRQTLAYALSLVMSCVCYSSNDPMTKGCAEQVYKKLLDNYSK
jgi:hypothetical protein